jgi:hypothetical protein
MGRTWPTQIILGRQITNSWQYLAPFTYALQIYHTRAMSITQEMPGQFQISAESVAETTAWRLDDMQRVSSE